MKDLLEEALYELKAWIVNGSITNQGRNTEPHDAIHEIADSSTPIYTANILQLASDNWELILNESDIGAALDGSPTPLNIIVANIYDAICNHLWEWWNNNEQEVIEYLEAKEDNIHEAIQELTCELELPTE